MENELRKLLDSFLAVETWVSTMGYRGYDPFDIRGVKNLLFLQRTGITRKLFNGITILAPIALRALFNIEKNINAKAMALFAWAYLTFYRYSRDQQFSCKARLCLDWLIENSSRGFSGYCWGYPFHWQSRILIPKQTPSGVVTSIAIETFLNAYRILNEKRFLDVAESGCQFIINDLNWNAKDGCFSYTPLDHFHVHNANLLAAMILYKVSSITKKSDFITKAEQAVNYSIRAQNEDGSWYYWGEPDNIVKTIDHFHTGFILRALYDIYKITLDQAIYKVLKRGVQYYRNQLFSKEGFPLYMPKRQYPIDIHTCAEAILASTLLKSDFDELRNIDRNVVLWTIANMQDSKGYFYYQRYKSFTMKTDFIRWGAAWMMLALAQYLSKNFAENKSERED